MKNTTMTVLLVASLCLLVIVFSNWVHSSTVQPCGQDPMHTFESCMDALGNMEADLPPNFPAGKFCNLFEEARGQ